ncbi:MAG: HAD-IC family P-type ATPase, partial [Bacilli bacterium]
MKKPSVINDLIEKALPVSNDIRNGLSSEEVRQRIKEGLVNKTKRHVTKTYAEIIFSNLISFFNILLVIIAIFMIIAEQYSGLFFLFILFANILIGLFQDIRARMLVDKLSLITNPKATVVRNGVTEEIDIRELVLSDILILKTGDQISIDAIVADGQIAVNESLLTGEAIPFEKNNGDIVLSGSFVTSGSARVRATSVGQANYAEQLQNQAKLFKRPKSDILKSMRLLFRYIGAVIIIFSVAYVLVFSLRGGFADTQGFKNSVGAIAGSLVAMIPSGMYLLTSMTLAVGVIRLASRRMLVQELYSIENLARVDVLCLDKTGTLTDGKMNVKEIIPIDGEDKNTIFKYIATLYQNSDCNNQTALALLDEVGEQTTFEKLKFIPFSSDRKYSAATIKEQGTIIIGAQEIIHSQHTKKTAKLIEKAAKDGYRVLIISKSSEEIDGELPHDLKTIAIAILQDHLRDDAKENIAWFQNNEVAIKIISGDNINTVSEIARQVGVEGFEKAISLEGIDAKDVAKYALKYNVFGRV